MLTITSDKFLNLLFKNEDLANNIINNYKDIEADIKSYRADPDCSCKFRISKFFDINADKISSSIEFWAVGNNVDVKQLLDIDTTPEYFRNVLKTTLPQSEWGKFKDVIGEVIEISPDPEEYKKVITIAREKWLYNGINILETVKFDAQTQKESIVWLILFY